MAIPTYEDLMLPLLKNLEDKKEKHVGELIESLIIEFNLSKEEREQLLPSGKQRVIANRVGWSRTHLKKAGLLEYVARGVYKITRRGLDVLQQNPNRIDNKTLRQFPEFNEFQNQKKEKSAKIVIEDLEETHNTPEESLETAYETIRSSLASEILEKIKSCSPSFFERLVVELLVAMGYGGTLQDAGKAVGKSGDGGIDGII